MYANQIDTYIDLVLNRFYLRTLEEPIYQKLTADGGVINLVEYREEINSYIRTFVDAIDITPIIKLINNKDNFILVIDIIKRYIAYYFFLLIAYHYPGTIKDFRNNIIQYSKLQESSGDVIRNFFDSDNNHQLVTFFKLIKDASRILLMTDLQLKTINRESVKEALTLIQSLGKTYVDSYLLEIKEENDNVSVTINIHGLIKTLVFRQIYYFQDRDKVFEILNEIEEDESEYIYIDVVVNTNANTDYETIRNALTGRRDANYTALEFFEIIQATMKIVSVKTADEKNLDLIRYPFVTPIVDDFMRYHRDTERLEVEIEQSHLLTNTGNNVRNIQMALLQQQKKKKDVTRIQVIVNKVDIISDYYSPSVKNNERLHKEIAKLFQNPFSYRKAIMHNHQDEVNVANKMQNQGRRFLEGNEYFQELQEIIYNTYFNFKDFRTYGTTVGITSELPIKVLRYCNIEFKTNHPNSFVEVRSGSPDSLINLVGLAIGPVNGDLIDCVTKEKLIDIRSVVINYLDKKQTGGKVSSVKSTNGYQIYLGIIKLFYIDPITAVIEEHIGAFKNRVKLVRNSDSIVSINPDIASSIIYWEYDTTLDTFDMSTYESFQESNFVEYIRFMNASLAESIHQMLLSKLHRLISGARSQPLYLIEEMVQLFDTAYRMGLTEQKKTEMINKYYLRRLKISDSVPASNQLPIGRPIYQEEPETGMFLIRIDTRDFTHLRPYVKIEAYSKEGRALLNMPRKLCQHEEEWKYVDEMKDGNINEFNNAITGFTEKYSIQTPNKEFVCRICGELLPIKDYVADGSFDDAAQKFVSSYVSVDIPLEEHMEYAKYPLTIKFLDSFVNRVSLVTGINVYTGGDKRARQSRQGLIKNILDIILEHNAMNIKKKVSDDIRAKFIKEKYGIDERSNSVYFFDLNDVIFKPDPSATAAESNERNLKYNNILLYFLIIFFSELNGPQIVSMTTDGYSNIYHYLNKSIGLFRNLRIKTNTTDLETLPITDYPVLCYLLHTISYYLIRYRLWLYQGTEVRRVMPQLQQIMISSFLDIFNGISSDAGRNKDSYVYLLTSSKMYQSLNNLMRNNLVLDALKTSQIQYASSDLKSPIQKSAFSKKLTPEMIEESRREYLKPFKLPTFRPSYGKAYLLWSSVIDHPIDKFDGRTVCPDGEYQKLTSKGIEVVSTNCPDYHDMESDLIDQVYYYRLEKLATKKCIEGSYHDFQETSSGQVCRLCQKTPDTIYTHQELDQLVNNLHRIQESNYQESVKIAELDINESELAQKNATAVYEDLMRKYKKHFEKVTEISEIADLLINPMESLIGKDASVEPESLPVYIKNNVYLINHNYQGGILPEPMIINQASDKIMFKENHPFFKVDVYYYRDNSTGTEVYYHAMTLSLLGYREKHRDYTLTTYTNLKLRIILSMKNRLVELGYPSSYIDMSKYSDNLEENTDIDQVNIPIKRYYRILDTIIQDHIIKIKSSITKFASIIHKTINETEGDEEESKSYHMIASTNIIVSKYRKQIQDIIKPNEKYFQHWQDVRDLYSYQPVEWEKTVIGDKLKKSINSSLLNFYDTTSRSMMYYLIVNLKMIYDDIEQESGKITFSQLIFDIINHIFQGYRKDSGSMEILRYQYIVNQSPFMIDTTRKGQGLTKIIEETPEDTIQEETDEIITEDGESAEDLKYEAEALDVEVITYGDADVDVDDEIPDD
jgi:hypothetical protein